MSTSDHELSEGAERRPPHSGMYSNVIAAVAGAAWAIHPAKLAAIVQVLSLRARGERFTREEIEQRLALARAEEPELGPGYAAAYAAAREQGQRQGIAVLRLMGMIAPRQAYFENVSAPNGTSVEAFTKAFREALGDPSVGAVLIDIDSPGGIADMVPELASEIRGARGEKPIVAIANSMAASAAYWIGSQADELVVTPSGDVGSIGVYAAHEDWSVHDENLGVKTTLVSAGQYKVEGNPFEPLSEDAREEIQRRVDEIHGWFVADVAKGRGTTPKDVRENFGQGRMLSAPAALKAGMVDRVETFDQTVARMLRSGSRRSARSSEAFVMAWEDEHAGHEPAPVTFSTSAPTSFSNDEIAPQSEAHEDPDPAEPETVQDGEPEPNAAVPVESSHQFAY